MADLRCSIGQNAESVQIGATFTIVALWMGATYRTSALCKNPGRDNATMRYVAPLQSLDGSTKACAKNTTIRNLLPGSTHSIQRSLDDDNGAMVNVTP
jgi:hypothetical protein